MRTLLIWTGLLAGCMPWLLGCSGGNSSNALTGDRGTITGSVSDFSSAAMMRSVNETATVGIDGADYSTTVAPDGTFTLTNVPAGLHTLVARNGRHAGSLVVSVGQNRTTDVGEIVTGAAGQISGIIRSAPDHAPIAGAKVTATLIVLTNSTDQLPVPVRVTHSNRLGSYTIDGLPVGNYLVTITKDQYVTTSLTLSVNDGATTPGDALLTPAATPSKAGAMAGTAYLVEQTGVITPIGGVLIRLTRPDDTTATNPMPETAVDANGNTIPLYGVNTDATTRGYYTYTNNDGSYLLKNIPAGDYLAVAVRPGLEPDTHPVTIVANASTLQDFKLSLRPPESGTIEGIVTDANTNAPIAGAVVRALLVAPAPTPIPAPTAATIKRTAEAQSADATIVTPDIFIMTATTDAQGRYKLIVPARVTATGTYARGYLQQIVPVTVQIGQTIIINIALSPITTNIGKVVGHVKDARTGAPIAGALVRGLYSNAVTPVATDDSTTTPTPDLALLTKTDDKGNYALKAPARVTIIAVSKAGYQPKEIPVTVIPNDTVTVNVALIPVVATLPVLNGHVYQQNGGGTAVQVAEATVYAQPLDNATLGAISAVARIYTAATDKQGAYKLTLPPGKYLTHAAKGTFTSKKVILEIIGNASQDYLLLSPVTTSPVL